MLNIFEQQANALKEVRESAKVIPLPTRKHVEQLREEGKSLVHKPEILKNHPHHESDDDFGPEAA